MFHHHQKLSGKDIAHWTAVGPATDPFDAQACADTLERTSFFTSLRPADRRALGAVGVLRSYPAGVDLVREGQYPGVGLYMLMRGGVRVTQRTASGGVRLLAVLGPGELFGEMALLDEQPRSATVTAIAPTLAFIIPICDFRAVLQHNPEALSSLLTEVSRRVRVAEASRVH